MEGYWIVLTTACMVASVFSQASSWAGGGLCHSMHVDYVTSRFVLATPHYPQWASVRQCACVVTMTTRTLLQTAVFVEVQDEAADWCEPEVQLVYRGTIASVCPSLSGNVTLEYETEDREQFRVIVRNSGTHHVRATMHIEAIDGSDMHVSCGGLTDSATAPPSVLQDFSQQGAEKGALAAGSVVLVITLIILGVIFVKLRRTRQQKPSHADADVESVRTYQRVTSTEETATAPESEQEQPQESTPAQPPTAVIRDKVCRHGGGSDSPGGDRDGAANASGAVEPRGLPTESKDASDRVGATDAGSAKRCRSTNDKSGRDNKLAEAKYKCDNKVSNGSAGLGASCNGGATLDRLGRLPSLGRKSPRMSGRVPGSPSVHYRGAVDNENGFYPPATPSLIPRSRTQDPSMDAFDRSRPGSTRSMLSRSGSTTSRPSMSLSRPGSARLLPKHPVNLQRVEYQLRPASENQSAGARARKRPSTPTSPRDSPVPSENARAPIVTMTDDDFEIGPICEVK